jgi:hypothetical protein
MASAYENVTGNGAEVEARATVTRQFFQTPLQFHI